MLKLFTPAPALGALALMSAALCAQGGALMLHGPSSSQPPYLVGAQKGVITVSILTTGDSVNLTPAGAPYRMAGIPDGMGAFENTDGTISVLMNHEINGGSGVPRRHSTTGGGAFVSQWKIRPLGDPVKPFEVVEGEDLIQQVSTWDSAAGAYASPTTGEVFERFCSADLAKRSAWRNGQLGFDGLLFTNGEESSGGQAWAHVVLGAGAGTSYELPRLGRAAWENIVANPGTGVKTVVVGVDDSSPGQVYVYVGQKQATGNPVEQAGLNNGLLYGVRVMGLPAEVREVGIPVPTSFDLAPLGDVTGVSGSELETLGQNLGVTAFLRPEDGSWDPSSLNDFYFVTTDRYDQVKDGVGATIGRTRLYRLRFVDRLNPLLGGTIEMLLDGSEAGQMYDNICFDRAGHILLQEDVGGQGHNGKIWQYAVATDELKLIAMHDKLRFGDVGVPAVAPYNNDEESSGIIDAYNTLGRGWFLLDVQAHYPIAGELFQGGQMLALYNPDSDNDGNHEVPLSTLVGR
jgi:hypothetical protein